MKIWKWFVMILIVIAFVIGCAFVRKAVRTVNDIASDLCLLVASEQEPQELQGLTADQWCAIHENLAPFIDIAFSAKADAAGRAGFKK